MRALKGIVFVVACLVLPAAAYAQASIAGVVRDTSGAGTAWCDGRGSELCLD